MEFFSRKFYLCLPSFIMRNAVSSYFSSARNELHPSFAELRSDFFFFFHSGRVRVAKTRNFVKYHYFEAPTSIKNIVYNGPKPVDSRCPLSAVILLFPRNFSFLFSPPFLL